MKKIIFSVMLAASYTISAKAQLADGFYHIKNAVTGRYISINDTDPQNYKAAQAADVNMAGIRTYINYDTVAVSPSCVIFVRNLGNGKYDLVSQGSSLYTMANKKLAINITSNGNGTYKIHGTAQGITKYLSDGSPSESDSWMMNRLTETQDWIPIPINTIDEYMGIRPTLRLRMVNISALSMPDSISDWLQKVWLHSTLVMPEEQVLP